MLDSTAKRIHLADFGSLDCQRNSFCRSHAIGIDDSMRRPAGVERSVISCEFPNVGTVLLFRAGQIDHPIMREVRHRDREPGIEEVCFPLIRPALTRRSTFHAAQHLLNLHRAGTPSVS